MNLRDGASSLFWRSGLSAAVWLGLSVPALLLGLFALADRFPMSHATEQWAPALLFAVLLLGLGLAGAQWGRALARQSGEPRARRLAWAAGLTFGPLTLAAMQILGQVEVVFVQQRLTRGVPIHIVFAIVFTVATFAVTAGVALAVGWAARGWRFGLRLALWAGLAAALGFLVADIAQDLVGRRVGAPGAERTATMMTVTFVGNLIAAFVGGGVMGWRLGPARVLARSSQPIAVEANP